MDCLWIILLIPLFYIPMIAVISLLAALISGQKGKKRNTFWSVFQTFFEELLNPFNWLS